jgi:formylglycine-generating enzyme required for sulfatase activity
MIRLSFSLLIVCAACVWCGDSANNPAPVQTPAARPIPAAGSIVKEPGTKQPKRAPSIDPKNPPKSIVSESTGMELVLIRVDERQSEMASFYIGKYEVTQGEWEKVMGTTPWKDRVHVKEGPRYPASYVSFEDAKEFSAKMGKKDGRVYRLPRESEWKYAFRAGTKTAYSYGDSADQLGDYAWFSRNTTDRGELYPHEVGKKKPNPWGLFDMHGNVAEWCDGFVSESFLPQNGGNWSSPALECTSSSCEGAAQTARDHNVGFRVAAGLMD